MGAVNILNPSPIVADPEQATADARTDTYGFSVLYVLRFGKEIHQSAMKATTEAIKRERKGRHSVDMRKVVPSRRQDREHARRITEYCGTTTRSMAVPIMRNQDP